MGSQIKTLLDFVFLRELRGKNHNHHKGHEDHKERIKSLGGLGDLGEKMFFIPHSIDVS